VAVACILQSAFYNPFGSAQGRLQLVHGFRLGRGLQCGCAHEDRPPPAQQPGKEAKKLHVPFSPDVAVAAKKKS